MEDEGSLAETPAAVCPAAAGDRRRSLATAGGGQEAGYKAGQAGQAIARGIASKQASDVVSQTPLLERTLSGFLWSILRAQSWWGPPVGGQAIAGH